MRRRDGFRGRVATTAKKNITFAAETKLRFTTKIQITLHLFGTSDRANHVGRLREHGSNGSTPALTCPKAVSNIPRHGAYLAMLWPRF